jgi:hypothetical protein
LRKQESSCGNKTLKPKTATVKTYNLFIMMPRVEHRMPSQFYAVHLSDLERLFPT